MAVSNLDMFSPTIGEVTRFGEDVAGFKKVEAPKKEFAITDLSQLLEKFGRIDKNKSFKVGDYVALSHFLNNFNVIPGMSSEISTVPWADYLGKVVGTKTDDVGNILQYKIETLSHRTVFDRYVYDLKLIGKLNPSGSVLVLDSELSKLKLTRPNKDYEFQIGRRIISIGSLLESTAGEVLENCGNYYRIFGFVDSYKASEAKKTVDRSLDRISRKYIGNLLPIKYPGLKVGDIILYDSPYSEVKQIKYMGICSVTGSSETEQMFSRVELITKKGGISIYQIHKPFLFSYNPSSKPTTGRVFSAEEYSVYLKEQSNIFISADNVFKAVLMKAIDLTSEEIQETEEKFTKTSK